MKTKSFCLGTFSLFTTFLTFAQTIVSDHHKVADIRAEGGAYQFTTPQDISDTVFDNNSVTSIGLNLDSAVSVGGAIHSKSTISITNSMFVNNKALSLVDISLLNPVTTGVAGGALCLQNSNAFNSNSTTLTNVVFKNNSSDDKGGAIAMIGTTLNFNTTENSHITSFGNKAKDDSSGGFLHMRAPLGVISSPAATVNFNIAANSSYTIGDGRAGYDSIASVMSLVGYQHSINKMGAGDLLVNSSMEFYTGNLNINAGTMQINGKLGASSVTIASGAKLGLALNGNYILTNSALIFDNKGTLILSTRGTGAETSYTLAKKSGLAWGNVSAYGGRFNALTGIFTVGKVAVASSGEKVNAKISSVDNAIINAKGIDGRSVIMSFDTQQLAGKVVTISAVTDITKNVKISDVAVKAAFDFDVLNVDNVDMTVVLSFYLGNGVDISQLSVWHKGDSDTEWSVYNSDITYDSEFASFMVNTNGFGSYAVGIIPESSTYALIFSILVLGLVVYRRRN